MILFFGDYLRVKNLRHQLISSSDIDDQGILQSASMRDTSSHNQPKVVALVANFAR